MVVIDKDDVVDGAVVDQELDHDVADCGFSEDGDVVEVEHGVVSIVPLVDNEGTGGEVVAGGGAGGLWPKSSVHVLCLYPYCFLQRDSLVVVQRSQRRFWYAEADPCHARNRLDGLQHSDRPLLGRSQEAIVRQCPS